MSNTWLPSAALALLLSSCSLFNSVGNLISADPDSGRPVDKSATITAATTPVSTPATKPATRPSAKKPKHEASHTGKVDAQPSKIADMVAGEWVIIAAGDTRVERDRDIPYINFDPQTRQFYASNGCNILNGAFELTGADGITFSHVLATMRLCPDVEFEAKINAAIRDGNTVTARFSDDNGESFMRLYDHGGRLQLTLKRHNLEFLNGQWQIRAIDGEDVDNPEMNIFFDIPELKVHGNTGCNYFNGTIEISPNRANAIAFANMGVTMAMCPNINAEMAMLVALEQTTRCHRVDANTVVLTDDSGRELLRLGK